MFSDYPLPTLRQQMIVQEMKECILIFPTSMGTGLIDFSLELIFNGNSLLVNHTVVIDSISISNESLERIMVHRVKRTQDILLISDVRTAKRIGKMFNGRLLSSQEIVAVSPKSEWFNPENNRLVSLIGDLNPIPSQSHLDELLQDEYPCKINPQEKQKFSAYINAKGLHWRSLVALANSLPLFLVKVRNSGVNDSILSKRFNW